MASAPVVSTPSKVNPLTGNLAPAPVTSAPKDSFMMQRALQAYNGPSLGDTSLPAVNLPPIPASPADATPAKEPVSRELTEEEMKNLLKKKVLASK